MSESIQKTAAAGGKIKCGNCENFPQALTYGRVYEVIAEDLEKGQYQVVGCNGRARWFPAYCFVPLDRPTPRFVSFQIDEIEEDQVIITLDDGTRRWLNLISLAHLAKILESNTFYHDHATVFVEDLRTADIESILNRLQDSGDILSTTRSVGGNDD